MTVKRATLSNFAPAVVAAPAAVVAEEKPAPASPSSSVAKPKRPTSVTVYLSPEEVRTLKLIALDHGEKITDICAAAIRDWLEKNGHARSNS